MASVAAASRGIPSLINQLCSAALFEAASRGERSVSTAVAAAVIAERCPDSGAPRPVPDATPGSPVQLPALIEPPGLPVPVAPPVRLPPVLRAMPADARPAYHSRSGIPARATAVAALVVLLAAGWTLVQPWPDGAVSRTPMERAEGPPSLGARSLPAAAAVQVGAAGVAQPAAPAAGPVDPIAPLLAGAEQQMAALALTTPAGANAVETYRAVQAIEPDSVAARDGLRRVGQRYLELADQAAARGDRAKSETYLDKAVSLTPELQAEADGRRQRLLPIGAPPMAQAAAPIRTFRVPGRRRR